MIDFSKYINIPFKHKGRNFDGVDCYGLLVLILKEEKKISLPEYEYAFNWYKEGCNYIQDNIPKFSDWQQIKEPTKPTDVILFYSSPSRKIVSHMGIYIGDDKFIHVGSTYKSRIDRLNDHWKNRIYAVLRCNFATSNIS
jgi:cell wall-associated NlpC family hydrolase